MYTQAKCERTRQRASPNCAYGTQQKTGRTQRRSAGAPTDLSLHETFPGPCSRGRAGIFTSQDQRQPLLLEMACLLTVCNDRRHLLLGYSPFLSPPPPITQLGGQHMPRQGALEDTSPSMLRSEVGRASLASRTSFSASSNSTE